MFSTFNVLTFLGGSLLTTLIMHLFNITPLWAYLVSGALWGGFWSHFICIREPKP